MGKTLMHRSQQWTEPAEATALAEMTAFVAVAEQLSFVGGADRLQRDATVVSRRVRALEARLGVRLLERTTRRVALTEAGRVYLERAQGVLRAIGEAERDAASLAGGEPRGHLRLALPDAFGRMWIAPLLTEFMLAHPRITVEAAFSNRFVDLVGERFDLAVRLGDLADSRLVARRVCGRRRLLCASPGYLARAGTPRRPADLAQHACLLLAGLPDRARWELRDAQGALHRVAVSGPLRSDDAELLVRAACAGLGILLATDWLVGRELEAGMLVPVLPRCSQVDEGAIHVVTPSGAAGASKTRAFSDWIAERLADPPWVPGIKAKAGRTAARD